ncbi:hypothetical protein R3P38DRAFT_2802346 [Favolaschia claudopus]|uniref:Uncharacterized protein n=1 Tax=Favolaschia claudopus TaxID=2862362 RepID=A0AAV9ZUT0_9AGAR
MLAKRWGGLRERARIYLEGIVPEEMPDIVLDLEGDDGEDEEGDVAGDELVDEDGADNDEGQELLIAREIDRFGVWSAIARRNLPFWVEADADAVEQDGKFVEDRKGTSLLDVLFKEGITVYIRISLQLLVMRKHAGLFALQTIYKQMELSGFYRADDSVRNWSEYVLASNTVEPGYSWEGGEEAVG